MFKSIRNILVIIALSSAFLSNAFAEPSTTIQNARFQILFNPNARADTFLLDTQTGKVWQLAKFSDIEGEPVVWNHMERIDDDKQLYQFVLQHGVKKTQESAGPSQ